MAAYNFSFSRELTEEEQQEFAEFLGSDNSEDDTIFDDSDADPNYVQESEDSEFDDFTADNETLQDIGLVELRRSIHAEIDDSASMAIEEVDVYTENDEEMLIEPNRGAKYIGQGKNEKTIWWSMPCDLEKARTESLKRDRKESLPSSTEMFAEKKDAFMRLFPTSIVEQIVVETNRKARNSLAENRHEKEPQQCRVWNDTNADEIYAFIGVLLHSGAEKANGVQTKDLFDKSNMPFYRAAMTLKRFEQLLRFLRFDDSRTRLDRLAITNG